MKTLWFKVESTGRAVTVKIDETANVLELMEAIIQQHSYLFPQPTGPALWNLYKSAQAQEPEDSGDSLDVLGEAGKTSRTALVLRRVSPASTAPANDQFNDLRAEFKELKESVTKYIEKAATIAFSALDWKTLERDGVKTEAITLPIVKNLIDYPKFKWINSNKEDAKENKDAYLKYVCDLLSEFKLLKVELAPKNLLDCDSGLPHHLKGTTDLIAFPAHAAMLKRNNLNIVFELKPNLFVENNIAQTIGEVIAANSLSHNDGSFPSPVGVLTDLMEQWALIWISKNGIVHVANTMVTNENIVNPLDRNTAIYYIKKHFELCNQLVGFKISKKRSFDESVLEDINLAFGAYDSGYWKSRQDVTANDPMEDFFDTMDEKEIEQHKLKRTWRIISNSNIFAPAAESSGSYLSMFS
jgi:hypothetical protein